MSELTPKMIGELANTFVESEFGQHFLSQLNMQYNALHQQAEANDISIERKAMLVERAAGLRVAIDYLMSRSSLHKQGLIKEEA